MDQISDVNIIGSLGFIPMCPKNIGLRRVKAHDKIAISLLNIFLFSKNKPSTPNEDTNQFIVCLISMLLIVCFTQTKLSKLSKYRIKY